MDIFMQNLPEYFQHFEKNPKSLLARIYGLFQVQMKGLIPVNFILMANTIKSTNFEGMKVYDLKGSTCDRNVSKNEGDSQTMKD